MMPFAVPQCKENAFAHPVLFFFQGKDHITIDATKFTWRKFHLPVSNTIVSTYVHFPKQIAINIYLKPSTMHFKVDICTIADLAASWSSVSYHLYRFGKYSKTPFCLWWISPTKIETVILQFDVTNPTLWINRSWSCSVKCGIGLFGTTGCHQIYICT